MELEEPAFGEGNSKMVRPTTRRRFCETPERECKCVDLILMLSLLVVCAVAQSSLATSATIVRVWCRWQMRALEQTDRRYERTSQSEASSDSARASFLTLTSLLSLLLVLHHDRSLSVVGQQAHGVCACHERNGCGARHREVQSREQIQQTPQHDQNHQHRNHQVNETEKQRARATCPSRRSSHSIHFQSVALANSICAVISSSFDRVMASCSRACYRMFTPTICAGRESKDTEEAGVHPQCSGDAEFER